jgi:hypothetical protein
MVACNEASLLVHHEFVNELFMAVLIKIIVFWDMTPCSLVDRPVLWPFSGQKRQHLTLKY